MIKLRNFINRVTGLNNKVESILMNNKNEVSRLKLEIATKQVKVRSEIKQKTVEADRMLESVTQQVNDVARKVALATGNYK